MKYLYLLIAIVAEVIATSALKSADGFTKAVPSVIVVAGYAVAFYFLSLTLRSIPLGVAYAMWSGIGVVIVAMIGAMFFKQPLDLAGMIGISFIVLGVLVLNLLSKAASH